MNKEEAKTRIAELSKIIEGHNYNYYILAQPTISDYDFDMLLNELIDLERQFPDLILPDSGIYNFFRWERQYKRFTTNPSEVPEDAKHKILSPNNCTNTKNTLLLFPLK